MEKDGEVKIGDWREIPAILSLEVVQTAVRYHLEKRGCGARQLEQRTRQRRQRIPGKKVENPTYLTHNTNFVTSNVISALSLYLYR